MDHEAVLLTQSGVEKLKLEKEHLINVERPNVIEELQLARSQGDLSENADYDSARDKQAHIESRIKEIDAMLLHVQIIDETAIDTNVAKPGATVTILDLSEKNADPEKYTIVGTFETDPLDGKISNESPLAKAILNHGINEIVSVGVAEPYEVKILKIEYNS
ncbi:MAG: transcription elongation factor GreA [Coprobacillus sp.]